MPDDGSELVQLHSVPNWSAVTDSVVLGELMDDEDVVSKSSDPLVQAFPVEGRDRLYVGAGQNTEGALKELRTGLKTNITVEFELDQYLQVYAYLVSSGYGVYHRRELHPIQRDLSWLQ
jgi:hypothetical protein